MLGGWNNNMKNIIQILYLLFIICFIFTVIGLNYLPKNELRFLLSSDLFIDQLMNFLIAIWLGTIIQCIFSKRVLKKDKFPLVLVLIIFNVLAMIYYLYFYSSRKSDNWLLKINIKLIDIIFIFIILFTIVHILTMFLNQQFFLKPPWPLALIIVIILFYFVFNLIKIETISLSKKIVWFLLLLGCSFCSIHFFYFMVYRKKIKNRDGSDLIRKEE